MASAEREPIRGYRDGTPAGRGRAHGHWSGPPETEGVLAFGCQKEVAKLSSFSVFCEVRNAQISVTISVKN